jgi:NADPH-dependent 2,4-dienoyl-CoA reductase/sulfur reductase-like enzyme
VIIGSSAAGLSAAEALRRRSVGADITIVSEEKHGHYSRPGLAYYLSDSIPDRQLFPRHQQECKELALNRIHGQAERIDLVAHTVHLADGREIAYDRLLLATGSRAVAPDFPGHDLAGVVTLDNLDDARHIVKLARKGRSAVIVGGGITALELVEGLRARGLKTSYLLRGERFWQNVLDKTESRMVEERLQTEGVTLFHNTQVRQAIGRAGRLVSVETTKGEVLPCEVFAVAIGVRPRCELARQAGLRVERGVLVDPHMQSSDPDVFAAGDVAEIFDPRSGRTLLDTLWSAACSQGAVAGANMAGSDVQHVRPVSLNVTQLAGITTSIMGSVGSGKDDDLATIARGDSETWRSAWHLLALDQTSHNIRVRLLLGEKTIEGAVVMGDQSISRTIYALLEAKADISAIRDRLTNESYHLSEVLSAFHRHWTSSNR